MTVPTGPLLVPIKSNINSTRAWGRSERRSRRYRSYTAFRYVPYLNYLTLLSLFIYLFTCAALPCFDVICFATNYKFSQSCKIGRKWIMMILFSSPLFLELMHTIRFDQKRVRPLFFLFSRSFLMFILKLQRFFFPYQYKISYFFFL